MFNTAQGNNYKKAVFAAGCFWGVEAAFRKVPGVIDVISGYTGGHGDNPTYEQVCAGDTGHAEAVEVTFDPDHVSYEKLVQTFFDVHDPTQKNRQGPDVGEQYRSALFYQNEEQKRIVEQEKQKHEGAVTEIAPAGTFWKAEEYHQRYHEKHGGGVCPV